MSSEFAVSEKMTGVDWNSHIVLKSKDEKFFKISRKAALLSNLLKQMLEDAAEGEECQLPVDVPSNVIPNFIAYCEYHKDSKADEIPQPLQKKIDDYISEWDKQFLYGQLVIGKDEKKHQCLLDLMSASHYFDCDDLLNFTCATVASMIQDKTPAQIRELFNLPDDFTPEQRQRNAEELKALSDL